MHGVPKDQLESVDLREMQRGRRIRTNAIIALSMLLVLAVVLSVTTFQQLGEARRQTAIATARAYAAEADVVAPRDPVLAGRLAVAAYRLDPSAQATTALMHAFERTEGITSFLEVGPGGAAPQGRTFAGTEAVGLDLDGAGGLAAAGAYRGGVRVWEAASGRLVGTYPSAGSGMAGTPGDLSDDGRRLTTSDQILSLPDGRVVYQPPDGLSKVDGSTDGRLVGLSDETATTAYVVDLDSPSRTPTPVARTAPELISVPLDAALSTPSEIAFDRLRTPAVVSADGSTIAVGDDEGRVTVLDRALGTQRVVAQLPAQIRTISLSRDGGIAGVMDTGGNVITLRPRGDVRMSVLPGTAPRLDEDDQSEVPALVPSPAAPVVGLRSFRMRRCRHRSATWHPAR